MTSEDRKVTSLTLRSSRVFGAVVGLADRGGNMGTQEKSLPCEGFDWWILKQYSWKQWKIALWDWRWFHHIGQVREGRKTAKTWIGKEGEKNKKEKNFHTTKRWKWLQRGKHWEMHKYGNKDLWFEEGDQRVIILCGIQRWRNLGNKRFSVGQLSQTVMLVLREKTGLWLNTLQALLIIFKLIRDKFYVEQINPQRSHT